MKCFFTINLDYKINLHYEIVIFDFFRIFDFKYIINDGKIEYQPFQEINMNENIINRFSNFVEKYSFQNRISNEIKNQLRKLKQYEKFILFLEIYQETNNCYNIDDIKEISEEKFLEVNHINIDKINKYKKQVLKYYKLITTIDLEYNNKYTYNLNINPKICKYCGNTEKEYFKNKSHIIPESIGGHLIDNLECDKCNSWFNENIEQDFSKILNPLKTIFCIKGKKSIPTINTDIVNIKSNFEKQIEINFKNLKYKNIFDIKKYPINVDNSINCCNIYKTLCKIALGVFNNQDMVHFSETLKWIKNLKEPVELPIILLGNEYANVYLYLIDKPFLNIYIRRNKNYNFPYMFVELNCRILSFYYIIPFIDLDKKNFLDKKELIQLYEKIFMLDSKKYSILDCNQNEFFYFRTNINFK